MRHTCGSPLILTLALALYFPAVHAAEPPADRILVNGRLGLNEIKLGRREKGSPQFDSIRLNT